MTFVSFGSVRIDTIKLAGAGLNQQIWFEEAE